MEFDEQAGLDTSRISDRRGQRGGGGGGLPLPGMGGLGRGMAVGGGGIGMLLVVLVLLLNTCGGGGAGGLFGQLDPSQLTPGAGVDTGAGTGAAAAECRTGADAERRDDCLVVAVENSLRDFWSGELARRGVTFTPAGLVLFSGATTSGCGRATSDVGPFYCPRDRTMYFDLGFFDELAARFGGSTGDFAKAYVVAHEYGHHVQNLTGVFSRVDQRDTGEQGSAVRSELQADCYAGLWAFHAESQGLIVEISQQDVDDALSAAASVGDDRIQSTITGQVNPHTWTHGSSEQRRRWFTTGLNTGSVEACDTFAAARV